MPDKVSHDFQIIKINLFPLGRGQLLREILLVVLKFNYFTNIMHQPTGIGLIRVIIPNKLTDF